MTIIKNGVGHNWHVWSTRCSGLIWLLFPQEVLLVDRHSFRTSFEDMTKTFSRPFAWALWLPYYLPTTIGPKPVWNRLWVFRPGSSTYCFSRDILMTNMKHILRVYLEICTENQIGNCVAGDFCQYWSLNFQITDNFDILIMVSKAKFQEKLNGKTRFA